MLPDWMVGLTHKDWLLDGRPLRGKDDAALFRNLDWDKAYADLGPSSADDLGPYWHVPLKGESSNVHQLYPMVLETRWRYVVLRICSDLVSRCGSRHLQEENRKLKFELAEARWNLSILKFKCEHEQQKTR